MSESEKSNREHSFDFELAAIVGVEKAILLKNISYWCAENKRRNQKQYLENDLWWTEESLASLAKKYQYMKRSNIGRWMSELFEDGWIRLMQSAGSTSRYGPGKTFEAWNTGGDWQSLLSQNKTVQSRPKMRHLPSQNETPTVPNRDGDRPKMRHNNIDSNGEGNVESNVEIPAADATDAGPTVEVIEVDISVEDGKNGTASKGAGPQTKSWSQRAATIFDEVNADLSKAERIEYLAFDWQVCKDENFNQLKNLKKIIDTGFPPKNEGRQPTDSEIDDCFRLIFTKAWHYFRKIQKDKGGALHYNPTSVYKSYNTIKTFRVNGNINGITTANGAPGTHFKSGVDHTGTFDPTRGY